MRRHRKSQLIPLFFALAAMLVGVSPAGAQPPAQRFLKPEPVRRHVVVGYESQAQLAAALERFPARVVRILPRLHAAEVEPAFDRDHFAAAVGSLDGISYVHGLHMRTTKAEPALVAGFRPGLPYEWQYVATRADQVPEEVLRAAAALKIAVVDTGADVRHPDLAAKAPETWNVLRHNTDVRDPEGHGTFVSTLAGGSVTNGEGIAGFGGDAQLLLINASGPNGMFTEVDEAAAIVYAVDHGAKVINLSLGGTGTSPIERRAVEYAAAHDVLLVAAAGNEYDEGNPVEYPAALLQPPGSRGKGGVGLVVGATTMAGKRAYFSNTGTHLSLAAPGDSVFGGLAYSSRPGEWPRYALPGSTVGLYGWSSGTSFSAPQVTGAAALVWAANPRLSAQQVATVLEQNATGRGRWNKGLGYGQLDVAAAVAAAAGQPIPDRLQADARLRLRIAGSRRGTWRKRMRRVRMSVALRTTAATISPAHRVVVLEIKRGGQWRRLARTITRSGGSVRWTIGLRPGSYRVRVRYPGRWDLREATRVVSLRV